MFSCMLCRSASGFVKTKLKRRILHQTRSTQGHANEQLGNVLSESPKEHVKVVNDENLKQQNVDSSLFNTTKSSQSLGQQFFNAI